MIENKATAQQENNLEKLHWELQKWKSSIHFMEDEMLFIDKLLHSYVFEPRTPNLFERLELFKIDYKKLEKEKNKLKLLISKHENTIGGILECTSSKCDCTYFDKHERLKKLVTSHFEAYRKLKSTIFNYAGTVLKRQKPS